MSSVIADSDFQRLVLAGEDDKVDRKLLFALSEHRDRAEMVKDVIALANSHGVDDAFLLFGVGNSGELVGLASALPDDAVVQQSLNALIEPPVNLKLHDVTYGGKRFGVLQIRRTSHWHVGSRDYDGKDCNGKQVRLLNKGDILIRSGSSRRSPSGWDYHRRTQEEIEMRRERPALTFAGKITPHREQGRFNLLLGMTNGGEHIARFPGARFRLSGPRSGLSDYGTDGNRNFVLELLPIPGHEVTEKGRIFAGGPSRVVYPGQTLWIAEYFIYQDGDQRSWKPLGVAFELHAEHFSTSGSREISVLEFANVLSTRSMDL